MNETTNPASLNKKVETDAIRGQHFRKSNTVEISDWKTELGRIKFCGQRQDSTQEQLRDLITVANRFGFHDAADFIKEHINQESTLKAS